MKRRTFLSATGTFGIVGAASGASVVSSVYTSLSEHVSLKEFSSETKIVLDHFLSELVQNVEEHGVGEEHISSLAMPVRIIKKEFGENKHRIIYKNKAGNYVDLSVVKDLERIRITDNL